LRQPSLKLRVRGHTDARGTETINDNLGQGRALTVSGFLQSLGVRRGQLTLETEGASQPACAEHTPACYSKSRRVDFLADTGAP
jgi:outer membrane protein OmpA-like peptidoglycan-associated protein